MGPRIICLWQQLCWKQDYSMLGFRQLKHQSRPYCSAYYIAHTHRKVLVLHHGRLDAGGLPDDAVQPQCVALQPCGEGAGGEV